MLAGPENQEPQVSPAPPSYPGQVVGALCPSSLPLGARLLGALGPCSTFLLSCFQDREGESGMAGQLGQAWPPANPQKSWGWWLGGVRGLSEQPGDFLELQAAVCAAAVCTCLCVRREAGAGMGGAGAWMAGGKGGLPSMILSPQGALSLSPSLTPTRPEVRGSCACVHPS